MAMVDAVGGLKPTQTPLESQVIEMEVKASTIVYPHQVVVLDAGYIVPATAGADGPVLGVCLDYASSSATVIAKATVCIDPDMVYNALADEAMDRTDFGKRCILASNAGSTTVRKGTAVVDGSSATATYTVKTYITFLGLADIVTPDTNLWIKCKLNALSLSGAFDAIS